MSRFKRGGSQVLITLADYEEAVLESLVEQLIDLLEGDPRSRAIGHRAGEWMFERHHAMFLRERMGPDLEFHP